MKALPGAGPGFRRPVIQFIFGMVEIIPAENPPAARIVRNDFLGKTTITMTHRPFHAYFSIQQRQNSKRSVSVSDRCSIEIHRLKETKQNDIHTHTHDIER